MGRKKRDLESDVNDFLSIWDKNKVSEFLRDIIPLFVLYHIDKDAKEFDERIGEEDESMVRVLRTIYLISKLAHVHAGELCLLNVHFKDLWLRMEKESLNIDVPVLLNMAYNNVDDKYVGWSTNFPGVIVQAESLEELEIEFKVSVQVMSSYLFDKNK